MVLSSLLPAARDLALDDLPLALCQSAASMFAAYGEADHALLRGAAEARALQLGAVAPLLAIALVNTLYHAKAEEDLARRDGLLDELRALAQAHPEDAAVRERLAGGLFNTLHHAKDEQDLARRDGLLDELRALAQAHPEDAAVREWLGRGLFNTLVDAEGEEKPELEAALRTELLALVEAHPEDGWVERIRLAGLV